MAKSELERLDNPWPEERYAELGICMPAGGISDFYLYLRWSEDVDCTPEIVADIDLEFYTKTKRDNVFGRLRKQPGCRACDGQDDYWWIRLSSGIAPNRISAIGDTLDELLSEWIKYCKAAGGLRLGK